MLAYAFAKKGWLEQPPEYSFSKFEGKAFLDAFVHARKGMIAALEKNSGEKAKPFRPESLETFFSGNASPEIFFTQFPQAAIRTEEALPACILALSGRHKNAGAAEEKKVYICLSGFVKSFEVSKKVFAEYRAGFRVSEAAGKFDAVEHYASLSLACLLFFGKSGNLKFLNVALKLNDFICSLDVQKLSVRETQLCLASLLLEKELAQKLFPEKGVPLW